MAMAYLQTSHHMFKMVPKGLVRGRVEVLSHKRWVLGLDDVQP